MMTTTTNKTMTTTSTSKSEMSCQEFVQNAWKKDLCSNCFKLKVDHENGVEGAQQLNNHTISHCEDGPPNVLPSDNGTTTTQGSSVNHITNDVNNSNNNNGRYPFIKNGGTNWTPQRKIGSNCAMLWEVGHTVKKDVEKNGSNSSQGKDSNGTGSPGQESDKEPAIRKENGDTTNGANMLQPPIPIPKPNSTTVSSERRGSVGFIDGSPQVIGYGGNDYEWDDQESSDELSDVDSLENFDLTEEDKAFMQLTDINTEFNADNSNLLNEALLLHRSTTATASINNTTVSTTQHHSSVALASKLTPLNFYSMPSKVVSRLPIGNPNTSSSSDTIDCETPPQPPLSPPPTSIPTSSSTNAQEFIRSHLYSSSPVSTSDTDDFLDDDTSEVSTVIDKRGSLKNDTEDMSLPVASCSRAGFQSVPVRKCSSSSPSRTSVQQLFKEEPVTAGERQAAAKNSLPITTNGQSPRKSSSSNGTNNGWSTKPHGCVPYGISNVPTENNVDRTNGAAPKIPSCPPPASNDESEKFPLQSKHRTKSHANEDSSVQESTIESQNATAHVTSDNNQSSNDVESPLRNRGGSSSLRSGSKNRDYATINHSCHYASSSVRTGSSRGHNKPNDTSPPIQLPPTPLTNPYSSTAILKGVPSDATNNPKSPQKPLVTKPKPKLPAKPSLSPKRTGSAPTSPVKTEAPQSPEPTTPKHNASEIIMKTTTNQTSTIEQNTANGYRTSVLYHEISEDIVVHDRLEQSVSSATRDDDVEDVSNTSFESRVSNLANTLDFNRRITKRQAPKPPQGSTFTPEASPSPHQQKQQHANSDPVVLRKHNRTYSPRSSTNKVPSLNGTPSPSPAKSSSTNFHCLAENRTSTSSLESYSSTSKTTSSPPSINGQDNQHHLHKETKSKKSRFSLKKLLKFGKDDHQHDDTKTHKGGKAFQIEERRGKLEIIHPIDLMQNNLNERQGNGKIGNNSPSTTHAITTESLSTSRKSDEVHDHDVSDSSQWAPNQEMPSETQSKSSSEEDTNNVKPPPPPRSRNSGDLDTVKEKPVRPPPPSKQPQKRTDTSSRLSDDTWQKSTSRNQDGANSKTRNLDRDKRNSFYGSSMEYANLGDIRNSFVPKKPGRCTSSMIDITSNEELTKCSNLSTSQEVLHSYSCDRRQYIRGQSEDVTYYAPTAEETWETDDMDELYVDQSVATSSEPSQPSSFTSDSLSSSSTSTSKVVGSMEGDTRKPSVPMTENLNCGGSGVKVYERVVLKKGNLEKVYAKLPIISPSTTESNSGSGSSSCILADVDESSEVGTGVAWPRRKSSRLSLRKAKSVVHKNLEDNYGAVVSANHQTLTQILEQVSMSQHTTTSKVKLLEDVSLHWNDFTLLEDSRVTVIGHMAFYSAIWQQNLEVTLMVTEECPIAAHQSVRNPCALIPTVEFEDHIPSSLLSRHNGDPEDKLCRGTVWVMERTRVETLETVADSLHLQAVTDMDGYEREVCFVLLQLINGLKHLQVLGIEEVDGRMDDFLLIMKSNDTNYRFVILSKGSDSSATDGVSQKKLSLCQCALAVMLLLLHVANPVQRILNGDLRLEDMKFLSSRNAFKLIGDILRQERATSLSQAKLLLEYMIWGPTDLSFDVQSSVVDCCGNDDEKAYQRWLDLERATVLNNLIRTQSLWQIRLTVFEEYMLSFLVRTCAKTLHEAAAQLQIMHK